MWFWLWLIVVLPVVAATDDGVARAIQQLGAAKHTEREQAQQFLWQAGDAARPALEQAARSADPEINLRARAILNDLKLGIRPDTPPKIREWLRQFHAAEDDEARQAAVAGLLAAGEEAEPALVTLAQAIPSFERRMLIFQPAFEPFLEAVGTLLENDAPGEAVFAAVTTALRWYTRLLPEEITVPTMVIPRLDRLGRTKEADAIFAQSLAALKQLLAQRPQSADTCNNIAWLCAVARRNLDEALAWSEKSNELARDNPAYLDTLAEIHFQKGNRDKALELNTRCIALDETTEYFQQQRARFQDGKPTDPVPDSGLFGH